MAEATVKIHKSRGCVWNVGDLIAGFRKRRFSWDPDNYSAVLCIEARELGPRGGVRKPARTAEIDGPSWASVQRAIAALGFTQPALTATEVRRGRETVPGYRGRRAA